MSRKLRTIPRRIGGVGTTHCTCQTVPVCCRQGGGTVSTKRSRFSSQRGGEGSSTGETSTKMRFVIRGHTVPRGHLGLWEKTEGSKNGQRGEKHSIWVSKKFCRGFWQGRAHTIRSDDKLAHHPSPGRNKPVQMYSHRSDQSP